MDSRPDRAFRIADRRFSIFDGTGALLSGGRWNSAGRKVIYASETYVGAVLEVLVHARIGKMPPTQAWIEIKIPDTASIEYVDAEGLTGWDAPESIIARGFGYDWLHEERSLILVVPSLPASGLARNILINQDHAEFAALKASTPQPVVWDSRLFAK